jgi:hypothetical protein
MSTVLSPEPVAKRIPSGLNRGRIYCLTRFIVDTIWPLPGFVSNNIGRSPTTPALLMDAPFVRARSPSRNWTMLGMTDPFHFPLPTVESR